MLVCYWAAAGLGAGLAQGESADVAFATERLAAFEALLDDGRAAVEAAAIGLDALAFQLAFEDAATIVDVVRDRVTYEPYSGVLRGAAGTLRSGAGNAFDQALLAAVLLGDAGYDVQIALTTLTEADARQLLAGAGEGRDRRRDLNEEAERFLVDLSDLAGDPAAARTRLDDLLTSGPRYDAEAVGITDRLLARLHDAIGPDVFLGADESETARVLSDVARYAWVQYRHHSGEPWRDAHPAWRVGEPPAGLTADETFEDTVPEADLHRVRIEVFVERRVGEAIEVTSLMDAWVMPTALIADVALTFQLAPLDGAALSEALQQPVPGPYLAYGLDAEIIDAAFFTVVIDGAPAAGAVAFDARGNVVPLMAAMDPAAGVVRAASAGAAQAAGALRGLGRSEPSSAEAVLALTGVWYEVTRVEPGGVLHTQRRYLIDRLGAEQRSEGRVDVLLPLEHHSLLTSFTISIHPGAVSEMALFDRVIARLGAAQPLLRAYLDGITRGAVGDTDEVTALLERIDDEASSAALEQLLLADALTRAPLAAGRFAYRWAPAVLAIERGFTRVDGIAGSVPYVAVDIHADPQRVLLRDGAGHHRVSVADTMRVGVWHTVTERAFVSEAAGAAAAAATPLISAVDATLEGDPALIVLRDHSDVARIPSHVNADDRALMERDLDRGVMIVIPDSDAASPTWWRIDVATGATLGVGRGGRGVAERAVVQATSTRTAKFAAATAMYVQCVAIGTLARTVVGIDSVPVRSCALPLIGVVTGGVTATSAAVYSLVMVASFFADVFGFTDVAY